MKILYVGYYCEESEWGTLARNNILALERAGVDVVCRAIKFSGRACPQELLHLEDKDSSDCDVMIQHVFPEHLVGSDKFSKNICILTNVVFDITKSTWQEKLEIVDEVWVQSRHATGELAMWNHSSSRYIPNAIDTALFDREPIQHINIPHAQNKCKFYTIGNLGDAEGLTQVLRSFHAEFRRTDPVVLMIVLYANSDQEVAKSSKFIEDLSTNVKRLLKLESEPESHIQDIVITAEEMSKDLLDIHGFADLYVSCNTSLAMPLQELYAVGFGSTPIIHEHHKELFGDAVRPCKSIYRTHMSERGGMFDEIDNANNYRLHMCDEEMRSQMRYAFKSWSSNPVEYNLLNVQRGKKALSEHSMENVGQQMKEAINGSL